MFIYQAKAPYYRQNEVDLIIDTPPSSPTLIIKETKQKNKPPNLDNPPLHNQSNEPPSIVQ